jgi:hypothetical protein
MLARVISWVGCSVRLDADGELLHEDEDSRLGLDGAAIFVAYMDEEGPVVLEGRQAGPGRFELVARSRPRRATLALDRDRRSLSGEWRERDQSGSWRIDLAEAFPIDPSG